MVRVFATELGILHIVLMFVFLSVLKHWKSVRERCFITFKTFLFIMTLKRMLVFLCSNRLKLVSVQQPVGWWRMHTS